MAKKNLIVIKYKDESTAEKGWREIHQLEKKHLVDLDEATMVIVDKDGKAKSKRTTELSAGKSSFRGGIVGLVIGLIFVYPVALGLLGAAFGALRAKAKDSGLSEKFLRKIQDEMEPGNVAIFVLVEAENFNSVVNSMKKHKGELFYTSISSVSEKKLNKLTNDTQSA